MLREINKVLLLSLSFYTTLSNATSPSSLNTYDEALRALKTGSHLQVISDLRKCLPASTDSVQLGGMDFSHFLVYTFERDGKKIPTIGMSNTLFIHKKELGYLFEYVRLQIFADNSVEFYSQDLNPKDYSSFKEGISYHCQLGRGVKLYRS